MRINKVIILFLTSIFLFPSCDFIQIKNKKQIILPPKIDADRFVGSEKCRSCHQKEYDDWYSSHHQLAMQKADSNTVLGDFDNITFLSKGVKYHFYKKDENYYVNTQGQDGNYHDYKIEYTFGVTPLQQYIVPFGNGKYQCLHSAWDAKKSRWFDLQPKLKIKHNEWMHWTGGSMNWNNMCADCHSTYLEKNYNSKTDSYHTTYAEINVGCEACHGPGDIHMDYYQNPDKYKNYFPPEMYMNSNMNSKELVQKCARCHSRRSMVTNSFDYQKHYLDYYYPGLMRSPVYNIDGQILDEDYVYGSFMQSRMYNSEGVSCRDCHDMHTMELKKQGNALCLNCHEPRYDSYQHHFHKINTDAAQCVNCHMPGRTYMGNDFRRDHSFRVPRPDQTAKYGTPNACNSCHNDKSAQWAADFIIEKYGTKRPKHFTDWLLPGLYGNMDSLSKLIEDTTFPEIIRATAVNILGEHISGNKEVKLLVNMLKDSSALVRREAIMSLLNLGDGFFAQVQSSLSDSIRAVRIAAARYFILNKIKIDKRVFQKAKKEYLTDLYVNADFASGQHQLALYYLSQGDRAEAKKAYLKALKIDNYFNMSRMNLALIEYEDGNIQKAEKLYLKVIEQEPEYSYPYYMLGLLYNEQNKQKKSIDYLAKACDKQPLIVRAYYNYALKLQQIKEFAKADAIINKALKKIPTDESLLYVKLLGVVILDKTPEAIDICNKLLKISPDNQNYRRIMNSLKEKT